MCYIAGSHELWVIVSTDKYTNERTIINWASIYYFYFSGTD
jgi:hypothetical protein